MAKWIKNDSGASKDWVGQTIADQAYYEIQSHEESSWANNSVLLTAIGSGDAIVAKDDSGNTNITDVNTAINYLKGNVAVEVRDTETTQYEKFYGDEVTAGTESEQAFIFTPANGEVWTIKEFWCIGPQDRNEFVSLIWDYEGAGEEELLFGKGGEKYKPQDMTVTGDGTKELAIVLCNCATSGSVKLAGLLKYNKA